MRDDWAVELYADIVRQAVRDHHDGYHGKGMDPGQWLRLAGLLGNDGQFDMRFRREEQEMASAEAIEKRRAAATVVEA